MNLIEKYAPQSLDDVRGQADALARSVGVPLSTLRNRFRRMEAIA